MKFCVKFKKLVKVKKKQTNYNFKDLETLEIVENLKKNMDIRFNNKDEWEEPVDKRWGSI